MTVSLLEGQLFYFHGRNDSGHAVVADLHSAIASDLGFGWSGG